MDENQAEKNDSKKSKKILPFGAWLLCMFIGAGFLIGIGKAIFGERLLNFSNLQIIVWVLANGLGLLVIISLLRFKKSSIWFLALMELLSYVSLFLNLINKNTEPTTIDSDAIFLYMIIRFLITASVLLYLLSLIKKKILT